MRTQRTAQDAQVACANEMAGLSRPIRRGACEALRIGLTAAVLTLLIPPPSIASEHLDHDEVTAKEMSPIDEARQARINGDPASAIAVLEGLLSQKPDDVDALVQIGFAHLARGDLLAAEYAFSETLRLAPDYADATLGLAYVAFRREELEDAEALASIVLEIAPEYEAARELLAATSTAKKASTAKGASRPLPRPIDFSDRNDFGTLPDPVVPDVRALPRPKMRRAFLSISRGVEGPRDMDLSHALEVRKPGGTLVFTLRHTSREYGDAVQMRISAIRNMGDVHYGLEFGLGHGADNLARAVLGVSLNGPISKDVRYSGRLRLERFTHASVLTFGSRMTAYDESGATISLGMTTSAATNVKGAATVIDAGIVLPLLDDMTLRLGASHGKELDGVRKRDVRSLAIGLARKIDDDLSVIATLLSEPGKRRIDFTLVRRF